MKRRKRILLILGVNLLLMGVGLVLLELIFGAWFNPNNLNRLNLLKNYVRQYDVSHLYSDPRPVIQYSRDAYGLRGTHGGRPERINMLTVGGSTTDQRYIRDGDTWQDVMQNEFAREGVTLVVANAGIDGQSTYGHIKNFEWWFPSIPGLAPKYILFYIGLNDFHKEVGYSYDEVVDSKQMTLKQKIKDNSAIWHMGRTLNGAYEAMWVKEIGHHSLDFSKAVWTREAMQKDYVFMEKRLAEYADRLRVLADLTRKMGAKPIFVSQPSRKYRVNAEGQVEGDPTLSAYDEHAYNGVDFYHMMRRLDRVTEAVAKEKDALFVDLAGQTDWIDADFYDFSHMTPLGAKKTGTRLWEALKGVFPVPEARGE